MPPILQTRRRFLAAAGASAAVGVAGCGSLSPSRGDYPEGVRFDSDWRSFRHDDANTGCDPDSAPPADRSVAWTSEFGVVPAGPTVADGIVFAPGSPLRAVDSLTGRVRWTHLYGGWIPPAVEDGTVFVPAAEEPALVGLDAATGRETWRVVLPGRPRTPPAFSNNRERLFVAVDGGRVCGVDRGDASVAWTRSVYGEVAVPLAANLALVFAATSTGELYCFGGNGEPFWRRNLHAHVEAPPVVGDERVYVGGMDGRVRALDRRNGGLAWEREVGGFLREPLALDGPRLYAVGGDLAAIDAETGDVAWRYESREGVECAPAVVGDTVLVGTSDGRLAALDADGGGWLSGPERWSIALGGYVGHWLAATDGRAYAPVMPTREEGGTTRLVAVA